MCGVKQHTQSLALIDLPKKVQIRNSKKSFCISALQFNFISEKLDLNIRSNV